MILPKHTAPTFCGSSCFRRSRHLLGEQYDSLIAPCQGIIQKLELLWDCQSGWVDRSGKLIAFLEVDVTG
ncbi:TPA: hypothetical protein MIT52_09375 [Klebsiella quasipneumoniae]|nr:hypothetical protein [Klebsiella quasipneumoniae]